jgi:sarcosine oxidase
VSTPAAGSSFDAIVVGLGGIGSATARALAERPGLRVLGIEQFELGHDRGASQDVSRIIRLSYHRRDYVELAKDAFAAWRAVEAATGQQLLTITGGLDLQPAGSPEPVDDYAASLSAAGVPFEWLDEAETMRRWPAWRLHPGTRAVYQADAGIVDPSRANVALRRLATDGGATLLERTRVAAIRDRGGTLVVATDDGRTFEAGSVVVAADAWTNQLLEPLGVTLPLSVTLEQVTWFTPRHEAAFEPARFPVWIWLDQPGFYGVPTYAEPGPKVGQDIGGQQTTGDDRTFEPDTAALARVETFLARHLPDAIGSRIRTKTCLYTCTPDRDFVVDRLPEHPGVVVGLGAAHGYKFAALFGLLLADLALDPAGSRRTDPRLEPFAIDRPALAASAPTNLVGSA